MASAEPAPSPESIEETIQKSTNLLMPTTTSSQHTTTTTSTTSPPQAIPKERASIMKLHFVIDSLVHPDKYSGPPDLRGIHNFNPLLVLVQWLANIHEEC